MSQRDESFSWHPGYRSVVEQRPALVIEAPAASGGRGNVGVMTLYEPFFLTAVDDTERAIILLHEAQHLAGYGEDAALERVWRAKRRLGWNAERYGGTKVWNNTREWTQASMPSLFVCGANHASAP